MANNSTLDKIDLTVDLIMSQLISIRKTVADLREKLADVSTPALGNGSEQVLSNEHIVAMLNRRERTRAKKAR